MLAVNQGRRTKTRLPPWRSNSIARQKFGRWYDIRKKVSGKKGPAKKVLGKKVPNKKYFMPYNIQNIRNKTIFSSIK